MHHRERPERGRAVHGGSPDAMVPYGHHPQSAREVSRARTVTKSIDLDGMQSNRDSFLEPRAAG